MDKILSLVEQLIQINIEEDNKTKQAQKQAYLKKMGTLSYFKEEQGFNFNVFYLIQLKELIIQERNRNIETLHLSDWAMHRLWDGQ